MMCFVANPDDLDRPGAVRPPVGVELPVIWVGMAHSPVPLHDGLWL